MSDENRSLLKSEEKKSEQLLHLSSIVSAADDVECRQKKQMPLDFI